MGGLPSKPRIFLRVLLVGVSAFLVAFLLLSIHPNPRRLVSRPNPATGYAEALERIQTLQAGEGSEYNPVCRLKFMDHGGKTEQVIVFIHGYTNCPEQFRQLGELFFERGYNVLITPLPHMGLADRMNTDQEKQTSEELVAYMDGVIDIAQGLGERVSVAGLSGGGVMAAWAAQNRSDLDLAITIAPSFGFTFIPGPLTVPVMNLFRLLPNFYQWWDPFKKMDTSPDYAYPRFSTRALAEILRLASVVQDEACQDTPAAHAILVITNDGDLSVVNAITDKVVDCWQHQGFQAISTYRFDANLKLEHDLIDPTQEKQRIDIVYPLLVELISK